MPTLKLAGGSTGTRKSSKSKAKPAAKRGPGRPRKSESEAPAKQTRQPSSNGRTRRPVTDDERVIKRHIKALTKAGDMRREAEEMHKEAVEGMYEATRAAMDDGVPTGIIIEYAGITRQWLYNMGKHRNRDNGGTAPKSAAKKTTGRSRSRGSDSTSSKTKRPRIRSIG